MIYTIQGLLANEDEDVQCKTLDIIVASMEHSKTFSYIMAHTYIYIDDLHELIFTPGIISAICGKLRDTHSSVRMQAFQTLVASMPHSKYPFEV
jgi:hypothetical protein